MFDDYETDTESKIALKHVQNLASFFKGPEHLKDITFDEYQEQAKALALPTLDDLQCALGLAGESGEVLEVFKKWRRGDFGDMDAGARTERDSRLIKEMGDVLFYLANMAEQIGCSLGKIGRINIERLNSRKQRGVLQGDGSDR